MCIRDRCKKGSLAFSPTGKGYSFGPAVYCLGICILVMVLAYLLLAMRRLHDRKRIREAEGVPLPLSLIHISEPTRLLSISYAVFCLKKKKNKIRDYYHT
eukprot:TRINITY_DN34503_c0_g1_i1.p1 TRINITY_DN34503_c0_g1~~TRINITY_DN34503_c0_g1_i1.p1  ORF type:complete len:100 (+),score=24.01 TRINITY_DN34503_c0_g1_i1:156-455(+)